MKELSLFSGAGGGLLGTKLLGWENIGYVEYNDYCQRIIKQRIEDGILDEAPIFGDIRAFISDGYAASYTGMVDIITAGFPCQPFSVAGKGKGENDERNMWPQTIECLRVVRPRYALLENVPGLLVHEYIRQIFADLAKSGYQCRWRILSAAELGAPHIRDRFWILCSDTNRESRSAEQKREHKGAEKSIGRGRRRLGSHAEEKSMADSKRLRQLQQKGGKQNQRRWISNSGQGLQNATQEKLGSIREEGRKFTGRKSCRTITTQRGAWEVEPDVGRVANGVANRVDRIKALGNGQVPAVVAAAWELLIE